MTKEERVEKFLNLTLEEKAEIVNTINLCEYELEYLTDYIEFTEDNLNDLLQDKTPGEIVRMTTFGDLNYTDDYIKIDEYGNLISFNNYKLEQNINGEVNKIVDIIEDSNIEF